MTGRKKSLFLLLIRVVDPDPHYFLEDGSGSALILEAGSRSGLE